jgi:hypothetical protein
MTDVLEMSANERANAGMRRRRRLFGLGPLILVVVLIALDSREWSSAD